MTAYHIQSLLSRFWVFCWNYNCGFPWTRLLECAHAATFMHTAEIKDLFIHFRGQQPLARDCGKLRELGVSEAVRNQFTVHQSPWYSRH